MPQGPLCAMRLTCASGNAVLAQLCGTCLFYGAMWRLLEGCRDCDGGAGG
jgi:hypothetical protein